MELEKGKGKEKDEDFDIELDLGEDSEKVIEQVNIVNKLYTDLLGDLFGRMCIMQEFIQPIQNEIKNEPEQLKLFYNYLEGIDDIFKCNYECDCKSICKDIGFNFDRVKQEVTNTLDKEAKINAEINK